MEVCSEVKLTPQVEPVKILHNSNLEPEETVDWNEITELLKNSKKLGENLEEEVAGMKKLKERYNSIMFKLSDLQRGRAAIARNMSDTKIILEKISAAEEKHQKTNQKSSS